MKAILHRWIYVLALVYISVTAQSQTIEIDTFYLVDTALAQLYTIPPDTDSLRIIVRGADGGSHPGSGALTEATFETVVPGTMLDVVIGEAGKNGTSNLVATGGGGGSAVVPHDSTSLLDVNGPIFIVAGGGGGLVPDSLAGDPGSIGMGGDGAGLAGYTTNGDGGMGTGNPGDIGIRGTSRSGGDGGDGFGAGGGGGSNADRCSPGNGYVPTITTNTLCISIPAGAGGMGIRGGGDGGKGFGGGGGAGGSGGAGGGGGGGGYGGGGGGAGASTNVLKGLGGGGGGSIISSFSSGGGSTNTSYIHSNIGNGNVSVLDGRVIIIAYVGRSSTDAVDIPTLSDWGLMILALSLLIMTLLGYRDYSLYA